MSAKNSYRDPYWAQLASAAEQRLGLPAGLLSSVVTHGERSNADQVSEVGAKTPFQITPSTRDAVLKRDGIDAYLSDDNAAEVAGLVLKDGMAWAKRHSDDPAAQTRLAAGYYHGGGGQANWGPRTNAYIARVDSGLQGHREDSLSKDFAAFMAANPATGAGAPDATAAPAAPAGSADKLSQDFGAWKAQQASAPAAAPAAHPTVLEKAVGAGEAALSAVTGIPAYLAGVGAYAGEFGKAIANKVGDAVGADGPRYQVGDPDQAALAASRALTYTPRTDVGQGYAQAIAEGFQPLAGLNPLEAGLLTAAGASSAGAAGTAARSGAARIASGAAEAAQAIRARVGEMTGEAPAAARPTLGTPGSAGAAGADLALQRQATADALPVPIKLTKAQATRDFADQQFENETAKNPNAGDALRENATRQNQQLGQNFDALIDLTGARQASDIEGARVVDQAVRGAAAASKSAYKAKYRAAEKAGELEQPVSLQPLADYLNANRAGRTSAPILKTIADELGVQGIGEGSLADGSLVGKDATLGQAEALRKTVNKFVKDSDPNDLRVGTDIKGVIDQITEGKGGDLYAEARAARTRHAQLFENNSIVSDLVAKKRGTADRKVALDDVMNKIILGGSPEDLSMLRRTLDVSDQRAGFRPGSDGPGRQAWNEIQAATLRHISDQAGVSGKYAARDTAGRPIVTFSGLNRAVNDLDKAGKLDFILGKQGAQTVRDIRDIAADVKTVPPGSINHSNTAATILAAVTEAGAMTAATGIPAPLLSIMKAVREWRQSVKLKSKVNEHLEYRADGKSRGKF